jgi:hypothetical protein
MEKKVFDQFGNAVIISDNILPHNLPDNEVAVDAGMAITHPAMIIETTDGSERYYLRTIESEIRMLVKVKKFDDAYIADQCQLNPTAEQIQELLKRGKQIK